MLNWASSLPSMAHSLADSNVLADSDVRFGTLHLTGIQILTMIILEVAWPIL